MAYPSLQKYIYQKYENTFAEKIEEYSANSHLELIDLWERKLPKYCGQIEQFEFDCLQGPINIRIGNRFNNGLVFTIVIAADFNIQLNNRDHDEITLDHWFYIECTGSIAANFDDVQISSVILGQGHLPVYDHPLKDELYPIIDSRHIENEAMTFIQNVCPEVLQKKIAINPYEVAKRLGLQIRKYPPKNNKVFGQIFFRDTHVETTDSQGNKTSIIIHGKTIYVNENTFLFKNYGNIAFTIIHECVHWWLHRKAFILRQLCGKTEEAVLTCNVDGSVDYKVIMNKQEKIDINRMEWQANAIAAAVIMPQKTFREAANSYIDIFNNGKLVSTPLCDAIDSFIPMLCNQFGTSTLATRKRLIDIGIEEAIGTKEFADGHYIKPYQFKHGCIRKNETFTIEFSDAAILNLMDPNFHVLVETGQYLFVDNHFILNDKKYIQVDDSGDLLITEYGRLHMDECSLMFKKIFTRDNTEDDARFDSVLFYNKTSGLVYGTSLAGKPSAVAEQSKKISEVLKHISVVETLGETIGILIDEWCKVDDLPSKIKNQDQIAFSAGVTPAYISQLRNGKVTKLNIEGVMKLTFAMQLPPQLRDALMKKANCRLDDIGSIDKRTAYGLAMDSLYCENVQKINEVFANLGFEPLGIQDEDTMNDK